MKNISMTSKQIKYNKEMELEPLPFKPDPPKIRTTIKVPPPPSPSKFIKGEFRESDYESDIEGRIAPVWRPYDSDSEPSYKPVHPVLTPTRGKSERARSATPPTAFDRPPQFNGPPRPKFEPIEKPKTTVKLDHILQPKPQAPVFKPTPVNAKRPTEPIPKNVRYYQGIAGAPIHTANYATETSNTVHMKESTENSHRVLNYTQTRRVIPLGGNNIVNNHQNFEEKLEPFPYEAEPNYYTTRQRLPPPPTPTKFIRGEFRESDYESEVDSARIRPVWTPNPSDTDEPKYRPVSAPRPTRATSLPRTNNYGRIISPLEFDNQPPPIYQNQEISSNNTYHQQKSRAHTIDRFTTKKYQTINVTRDDIDLKPGSPPKYGFIDAATNQMQNMNQTFKTKAEHFIQDLSNINKQTNSVHYQKPILKKTQSQDAENHAYRDESRVSQYGKLIEYFLFCFCLNFFLIDFFTFDPFVFHFINSKKHVAYILHNLQKFLNFIKKDQIHYTQTISQTLYQMSIHFFSICLFLIFSFIYFLFIY